MTINLLQTPEYRTLMQSHIYQTIQYLFDKNQEFALACEVKYITFTPELPADIKGSFDDTVLFILSGFTFESAQLNEEYFSFEAGFGSDNFGSTVSLPLLAIKQLFVGDNPIVINFANPVIESEKKKEASASKKSSMEALLKNPENKKLLKKKK
ncbi:MULTISPECIES: hypothetical protein [Sulfurovum]|uniref:Stringent starvation protein B n=1 Tax=Sulfurovum xiamenensis TaxID=3019066 RepID=A0ABT7QS39_9BACT|nr:MULTISPECIES: hypothetical protein [Sulfurovum]EIF50290.1 hypothetical protein SULAR_09459 [Sulfurovum sp. AR]MDM5263905.1 hypothetical protein [Sulfurovum xiamenensis]